MFRSRYALYIANVPKIIKYLILISDVTPPDSEFRSMFISTAFNVDWPRDTFYSTQEQQDQLLEFLDEAERINFNAVMFQVSNDKNQGLGLGGLGQSRRARAV